MSPSRQEGVEFLQKCIGTHIEAVQFIFDLCYPDRFDGAGMQIYAWTRGEESYNLRFYENYIDITFTTDKVLTDVI